jgi:hypothetical protein
MFGLVGDVYKNPGIKSTRYDSPSCRQRLRIVRVSDDTAPNRCSNSSKVSATASR